MKASIRKRLAKAKRRIGHRLRLIQWPEQAKPMFSASNIQYEVADRGRGLAAGGIGAMHLLARRTGLIDRIDEHVRVLKRHLDGWDDERVTFVFRIAEMANLREIAENLPRAAYQVLQRPLQPGKPHRTAQKRRPRLGRAGGQLAVELGLHGDGILGLVPEGLDRPAVAGKRSLGQEAPGTEADASEDGAAHLPPGHDPDPRPDRPYGPKDRLPTALVEPLATRLLPPAGPTAAAITLLSQSPLKPEFGRSGPPRRLAPNTQPHEAPNNSNSTTRPQPARPGKLRHEKPWSPQQLGREEHACLMARLILVPFELVVRHALGLERLPEFFKAN